MTGERPLYARDPEAWNRHLAEGNARQPRKRISADALVRDTAGRLLLVDPKYKPDWDVPGGMAEANEPPHETVRRELREELGLDIHPGALLCVDWVAPHGPWDDLLAFVFDGGVLTEDQKAAIRLRDDELASFAFCTEQEAQRRLRPYVWRRTTAALAASRSGIAEYLREGSRIIATSS